VRACRRRTITAVAFAAGIMLAAAGCGGSSDVRTSGGRLRVVAAENFYGDLARQVGGRHVSVTSILSGPDTDPHLFVPSTRLGLQVAQAGLVIDNGAGYDDWMSTLVDAAGSGAQQVLTVADVLHVGGPDANPHLWYDAPAMPRVVRAIGSRLTAADGTHAAAYGAGVKRAIARLQPLEDAVAGLRRRHGGAPVAYTERVPGPLLTAAGLRVVSPSSFARAVEDGTDPSPADVATMQRLLRDRETKVLLYNRQATSPLTQRLVRTAHEAGVPVVPVTETQPSGEGFVAWQLGQVRALGKALDS